MTLAFGLARDDSRRNGRFDAGLLPRQNHDLVLPFLDGHRKDLF